VDWAAGALERTFRRHPEHVALRNVPNTIDASDYRAFMAFMLRGAVARAAVDTAGRTVGPKQCYELLFVQHVPRRLRNRPARMPSGRMVF
jgi:hypothetical protein